MLIALREIGRSDKFLFGHQNTGSAQHAQSVRVDSDLVKAVGSYPAVVGFNLAQIHNQALRAALHEAQERGAVLTCSWEAPNPSTGGGPHDTSNHPVRQVWAGGPTAVRFEKMLDEISAFLKSLSGPVLFRPFHRTLVLPIGGAPALARRRSLLHCGASHRLGSGSETFTICFTCTRRRSLIEITTQLSRADFLEPTGSMLWHLITMAQMTSHEDC